MDTELKKKGQNMILKKIFWKRYFEKDIFKLINNAVFGKTMKNSWKHRDIELLTTKAKRNCLLSEPNYYTKDSKPICLALIIKIVMYKFWYDNVKPKHGERAGLCYMNTDSFLIHIKTEDIFVDNAKDIEIKFVASNYKLGDHHLKQKIKK